MLYFSIVVLSAVSCYIEPCYNVTQLAFESRLLISMIDTVYQKHNFNPNCDNTNFSISESESKIVPKVWFTTDKLCPTDIWFC